MGDAAITPDTVGQGGRYSITGSGFDRPVEVRTDWAPPFWIDVDGDGNLDANDTQAPWKTGKHTVELWQVSAADHEADGGYPYTEAIEARDEIPARDPDPDHPDFNNPDNEIDGSHPGTPAVEGRDGVRASKKVATLELKVTKAD